MSANAALWYNSTTAPEPPVLALAPHRLAAAKRAYTTRRVPDERMQRLLRDVAPEPGDLVLARVTRVGQHQHIEQVTGRRAKLWRDDEIIVAYGNRYAPDQFEALVPNDLGPCDLVAGGGVAARVCTQHPAMKAATRIEPIGLLADQAGRHVNLSDHALRLVTIEGPLPPVLAVVGCAMNAGKTTTAAGAIRGLSRNGMRVGAAKVTGTGSGGDRWAMVDAGAAVVLDFTDAGHASTFGLTGTRLTQLLPLLISQLAAHKTDAIVLELSDGLFQQETAAMVESEAFARLVNGVLFAADGAMGAKAGTDWLRERGRPAMGVSGVVSASPLARREAEVATGLPVLTLSELAAGEWCHDAGSSFRA